MTTTRKRGLRSPPFYRRKFLLKNINLGGAELDGTAFLDDIIVASGALVVNSWCNELGLFGELVYKLRDYGVSHDI